MPNIKQGPGNLFLPSEIQEFLAGETIAEGQVCCLKMPTYDANAGGYQCAYTAVLADGDGTAIQHGSMVAAGAIASGAWGRFYTGGFCPKAKGDTSIAAGDFIVPSATAGTADTMATGYEHQVFGVALDADAQNGLASTYFPMLIFKKF